MTAADNASPVGIRGPAARLDAEDIAAAIQAVAGTAVLHEPEFAGNEWTYVKECIDTGWVSTAGSFVGRFEDMLAGCTGSPHVIATVNGTAALHAALLLAGVGPGDEVIVPSLTFVATANAVAYCGAEPHFADIDPATLGLDADRLGIRLAGIAKRSGGGWRNRETGRPIRAVVCMHTFGHPCDLDGLSRVAAEFALPMIEDAAESLGSFYRDRHTGTIGRLGVLSFNGNKTVTTGGGGAVLTGDADLAAAARHLTTTAKRPHPWRFDHDRVGFNYRLPNINAALGCAQLEQLDGFLARKRRLAERYRTAITDVPGVSVVDEPAGCRSNFWLNALLLDSDDEGLRDAVLDACAARNIGARPAWTPMHLLPMYAKAQRDDLSVTESLFRRLVCLPSSPKLAAARHQPGATSMDNP